MKHEAYLLKRKEEKAAARRPVTGSYLYKLLDKIQGVSGFAGILE